MVTAINTNFEIPDSMRTLNPPQGFDPNAIAAHLRDRGFAAAQYEAAYKALEESTKSVLAQIAGGMEGSEAAKERAARSSDEFLEHLQKLADARFLHLAARVNFEVYKSYIDAKRSELSYQKAEMQIL